MTTPAGWTRLAAPMWRTAGWPAPARMWPCWAPATAGRRGPRSPRTRRARKARCPAPRSGCAWPRPTTPCGSLPPAAAWRRPPAPGHWPGPGCPRTSQASPSRNGSRTSAARPCSAPDRGKRHHHREDATRTTASTATVTITPPTGQPSSSSVPIGLNNFYSGAGQTTLPPVPRRLPSPRGTPRRSRGLGRAYRPGADHHRIVLARRACLRAAAH